MNDTGLDTSRCGDKRKASKEEKMANKEKSQKKPWGTDGPPPPEWVEMMRVKKAARLAEKERRRMESGLPDPKTESIRAFNTEFIRRPVLRLPGVVENVDDTKRITVMTYNVLAQALIRRRMFPSSGDALKWKYRSQMLTKELTHYQPTILCMQEVDLEQYEPYFVTLLRSLHYDHILLAAKKKRQGLLIAWKEGKYELIHRKDIHYDLLNAGNVGPMMWTGNVALCLGLKPMDTLNHGIWIANTHLYWHPHGSYERQRQAGILVSQVTDFATKEPNWPILICGDFNSTPWGMTYTALTQRPIELTPAQQEELIRSITFDFRHVNDEDECLEDGDFTPEGALSPPDINGVLDTDATNIQTTAIWEAKEYLQQQLLELEENPMNITPATLENNALVLAHHTLNPPLKSLYAEGLRLCQPDNAISAFGEPPFTNWAQGYRETLDYVFIVNDTKREKAAKLLGLLKMPRREEMGEGEPQEGRFPSDHVCEMVELEIS